MKELIARVLTKLNPSLPFAATLIGIFWLAFGVLSVAPAMLMAIGGVGLAGADPSIPHTILVTSASLFPVVCIASALLSMVSGITGRSQKLNERDKYLPKRLVLTAAVLPLLNAAIAMLAIILS